MKVMPQSKLEKRRFRRRDIRLLCRIVRSDGEMSGLCELLDVSQGGARIRISPDFTVSEQFILILSRDGRIRRSCRLVWRRDNFVGAEFIATPIQIPAPASAPEDYWLV